MMIRKMAALAALIISLAVLSGCAAYGLNARKYGNTASLKSQHTSTATVVHVRHVSLVNTSNETGTAAGAVLGGVAGSTVGHGADRALATIASALAGGYAGSEAQKHLSGHKRALQITVRGSNGLYTVVQPDDGTHYYPGQRVLVIQGNHRSRVSPRG